jgi:hypothetical protein
VEEASSFQSEGTAGRLTPTLPKWRPASEGEEGGLSGVPSWGQERQAGNLSYFAPWRLGAESDPLSGEATEAASLVNRKSLPRECRLGKAPIPLKIRADDR